MPFTQHILVVINSFSAKDAESIKQTINAYPQARVKLSLLYVIPNIPQHYYQLPSVINLKSQMLIEIKEHLKAIGEQLNVDECDQWIKTGIIKQETQRLAQSLEVDVIISNSLAGSATGSGLDPILTKKLWRQAGKISCRKFQDYLANLTAYTYPQAI